MRHLQLAGRYACGLARMRSSDVLVASFPRSGSTRLRLILAALSASGGVQTHAQLERTAPELGGAGPWARTDGRLLFIKTHRPYSPLLSRPRAILLLRHPLDALASFFAYRSALVGARAMSRGAFLRDARVGLPRWILHTRSWASRAQYTMRFTALNETPRAEITRMMTALGVPHQLEGLDEAIARATPDAAHRVRSTRAGGDVLHPEFDFARPSSRHPRSTFAPEDDAWAMRQLDDAGLMPLVETL